MDRSFRNANQAIKVVGPRIGLPRRLARNLCDEVLTDVGDKS